MTRQLDPSRLDAISGPDLLERLGVSLEISTEDGGVRLPDQVGLARLLRLAASRWGPRPRRDFISYGYRLLAACGVSSDAAKGRVRSTLDHLIAARDIEEVNVEGRPLLVSSLPRVVRCGDDLGFLCGAPFPGVETYQRPQARGAGAITRWLDLTAPSPDLPLRTWTLMDWLGEPGHVPHLRRRASNPAKRDLGALWRALEGHLAEDAGPLGSLDDVWVICGAPGERFGALRAERWGRLQRAAAAPAGRWLGLRGGYNEARLPCLVELGGDGPPRAMTLYNMDELRWALLSRGAAVGEREVVDTTGDELSFHCWLPDQLRTALEIVAAPLEGWRHQVPRGAIVELLGALKGIGGLRIRNSRKAL
ncbi:MAG: hypothetical protein H6739_32010 [Alphaproteobacteria bacterium]|nr:hypothetical protein [Alphaproteobacteria bacterium]